jgi:4-amino-4-deoxy-L-arabinose transferase-like glycosyltransferase
LPLLLAFVAVVYLLVQFDKPVHLDDPQYVYAARHLLTEPWSPLTNEINWQKAPVPAYRDLINPPFYMYLQAGWMKLFGESIRGLHVLATLMAVLAAACLALVARRFTRYALVAAALVLLSPNVLPIANLMVDVPVLAVGLAAVAVFVGGVDRDRPWQAILGGVLAGLAVLTKYNAIVLVPVLALYPLLRGRVPYARFMAIPIGMLLLWSVHNVIVFGEVHVLITAAFQEYEKTAISWWRNIYSAALVPGSSFVFLGVLALARARLRGLKIWGPLGAVLILGPTQMLWWQLPTVIPSEVWTFAVNTVLLVALACAAPKGSAAEPFEPRRWPSSEELLQLFTREPDSEAESRRRDSLFLWLWLAAVMIFQVIFAYHQAPRYHILALPPLAILVLRGFETAAPRRWQGNRALLWGSVGLGLVVALFVAAADDTHARANRDYPAQLAHDRVAGGHEIHCIGHWGFQYYCQEQGFDIFNSVHGKVRRGDLVVVPENNHLTNLPKAFDPLPSGRLLCSGETVSLLELVDEVSFPRDRSAAAPASDFVGTRLLAALHRLWPFSVSKLHHNLLYGALLPSLPYSWRNRGSGSTDERFMLLEARCDYELSGERRTIGLGSYAGRMHLVSGWGAPLPWRDTWGSWSVGPASVFQAALEHDYRDYVLRADAMSVRHPQGEPVKVAVLVNRTHVGELSFTPERASSEVIVPAEVLVEWENELAFVYSYMEHPIGEPARSVFFFTIDLFPVSAGDPDAGGEPAAADG